MTIRGLVTEPHSQDRVFSLWGYLTDAPKNKKEWLVITINFNNMFSKQCMLPVSVFTLDMLTTFSVKPEDHHKLHSCFFFNLFVVVLIVVINFIQVVVKIWKNFIHTLQMEKEGVFWASRLFINDLNLMLCRCNHFLTKLLPIRPLLRQL